MRLSCRRCSPWRKPMVFTSIGPSRSVWFSGRELAWPWIFGDDDRSLRPQPSSLRDLNQPLLWVLALIAAFVAVGTVFRRQRTPLRPANGSSSPTRSSISLSPCCLDYAMLHGHGSRQTRYRGLFRAVPDGGVGWLAGDAGVLDALVQHVPSKRDPQSRDARGDPNRRVAIFIAGIVWFAFLMAFLMLGTFWHQEVTGSSAGAPRFWHNAIAGGGAFAPGPVVIFGVPLLIFACMAWRVALRQQRASETEERSERSS